MRVIGVIPARFGSTRFPGKPLADLLGRPMIRHVFEAAAAAEGLDDLVVATDDDRIAEVVEGFGGRAVRTRADHPSGTDRVAEVAERLPADAYLNVQGDEPLVDPRALSALAALLRRDPTVEVATLCHPIGADEAADPNRVKVVRGAGGDALYFSRSPIPFPRDGRAARWSQHVGVYAYRRRVVLAFPSLPVPMLEEAERLEQLRLLHAGVSIRVIDVERGGPGVDTPEDLARVAEILADRR